MSGVPPKAEVSESYDTSLWFEHGVCQPAQCRVNRVNLIFDRLWLAAPRTVAPRNRFCHQEGPANLSASNGEPVAITRENS
jgi:hypothetical protein